jgi:glutamate 5-kinase
MSNDLAVIKHGSSSVENYNGIGMNQARLNFHMLQHLRLRESGLVTVEVSSGAAVEGAEYALEMNESIEGIDATELAQHGTSRQTRHWEKAAAPHGIIVIQGLVTNLEIDSQESKLIVPSVLKAASNKRRLVIINENPIASKEESEKLQASQEAEEEGEEDSEPDNDWLAAHVAVATGAKTLMLLSNVGGLKVDGEIRREVRIDEVAEMIKHCVGTSRSGKNGMRGKLLAAQMAAEAHVDVIIGHAFTDAQRLLDGHEGTRVLQYS